MKHKNLLIIILLSCLVALPFSISAEEIEYNGMELQLRDEPLPQIETRRNLNITIGHEQTTSRRTGFGGGTWMPIWFDLDMRDINELLTNIHPYLDTFDDQGLFMHGGGGKITVGRGLYIGGMGAGRGRTRNFRCVEFGNSTQIVYGTIFGGVTLDKRYALTDNIIISPGFMLGVGSHNVHITSTDGHFDWQNPMAGYSYSASYNRSFFVVQPRFELMYRLLGWLAIRGEIGYIYGYTGEKGWKAITEESTYTVINSPSTSFEGFTFSLGPWFGF